MQYYYSIVHINTEVYVLLLQIWDGSAVYWNMQHVEYVQ